MSSIESILSYEILHLGDFSLSVYQIIIASIIITSAYFINKSIEVIIKRRLKHLSTSDQGRMFSIIKILKYFIYVIACLFAVKSMGININILIAGSAGLFVGLGLALRDTFKDIIAGIIMLMEGKLVIGDILELNNTTICKIQNITLRSTTVKAQNGSIILIPNSKLVNEKIINWTAQRVPVRFSITLTLAYGSDLEKINPLLLQAANKHPDIAPNPYVLFDNFGESGIQVKVYFWLQKSWAHLAIKSDLRHAINQALIQSEISIPFPQRDVHLHSK